MSQGIPMVTFRLDDVPMNKSLEYFISTPHWLDALTPPLERHLDYLAETVALLLARPGPEGVRGAAAGYRSRAPTAGSPRATGDGTPSAPARRRLPVIVAAGIAVLALLAYVFFRPTAVSSAGVERQFAGTWTTRGMDKGKVNDLTMNVDVGGHYRSRVVVTESGTITASSGRYRMVSIGGDQTQGTYGPVGQASVTMTGPPARPSGGGNSAPRSPRPRGRSPGPGSSRSPPRERRGRQPSRSARRGDTESSPPPTTPAPSRHRTGAGSPFRACRTAPGRTGPTGFSAIEAYR